MALDPSISIIRGLQASVALDGLTVSVSPGMCYVPGTGRVLSDGTASTTLVSPTPNTFYHLYAFDMGSGLMGLEASAVAPAAPYLGTARCKTGDATRRYLISGRTNASGVLRPGKHTRPSEMGNRVMLDAATSAGSVPITLLSGLVATTPQTIDLSPPTGPSCRCSTRPTSACTSRGRKWARPRPRPSSTPRFQAPARCST